MDFDVDRPSRHCAASGRALAEGEAFYSILRRSDEGPRRFDYSAEAWTGPDKDSIAWWKSEVPTHASRKPPMAPNDVLLQLFDVLEDDRERSDLRYVLSLLLVRRRVFKLEEASTKERSKAAGQTLIVHCARRDMTYRIPVVAPEATRIAELQSELSRLLSAESPSAAGKE